MKIIPAAIVNLLQATFLLISVLAVLLGILIATNSLKLLTTYSGSMAPRYPVGGLLFAVPTAWETIREGDAVTVKQEGDGEWVTHRVVELKDTLTERDIVFAKDAESGEFTQVDITAEAPVDNYFGGSGIYAGPTNIALTLKGDANQHNDVETYLVSSEVWKPVFHVRGAGVILTFVNSSNFLIPAIGFFVLLIIVALAIPSKEKQSKHKAGKTPPPLPISPVPSYSEFLSAKVPSVALPKRRQLFRQRQPQLFSNK